VAARGDRFWGHPLEERVTETKVVAEDVARIEADAVVVSLFQDVKQSGGATGAVDKLLDGAINSLINRGEIKGKFEEVSVVHTLGMS